MATEKKSIAILLTVYNRKLKTIKCLDNIFNQDSFSNYEIKIFLTDDNSTDGTSELIKNKYPEVIITKGYNLYWNRGMWTSWNTAIKDKQYDFYLWLNDDTFTYPFMLNHLIRTSCLYSDKAIIVGPTIDTHGLGIHTYGGRLNMNLVPLNGKIQECDSFNGNIVLIPSYVYNIIGMNDPIFHHSLGDLDYGLRAHKLGIKILQLGKAVGECDRHSRIMKWCDPDVNLKERMKFLLQPTGYPPKEVFYFNKRHYGTFKAIIRLFTAFMRCIFPSIWIKLNKAQWI
jgi:GT2 family glycosyltransferase